MPLVSYPSASVAVGQVREVTRYQGSWLHLPDGTRLPLHIYNRKDPPWLGAGGVVLMPGIEGLGLPSWDRHTTESLLPGQQFRGVRTKAREVFWPLMIWGASRRGWAEVDSYFWSLMDPDPDVTLKWEWVGPTGQSRYLDVRPTAETQFPDRDPTARPRPVSMYGLTLMADKPFWEGPSVTYRFQRSEPQNWLPTAERPHVYISSAMNLATASVRVNGDVEAYPVWKVSGPAEEVRFGLHGRMFDLPWSFPEGAWMVVDSRPDSPTGFGAFDNTGDNRTVEIDRWEPEPVQPNIDTPLDIQFEGGGMVEVSLTPRWRRAW